MTYIIDNPAGGDCGFYAFSIALINIIKKEVEATGTSNTFNRWLDKGLDGVSLDDILNVNLLNLYKSPKYYKRELLDILQMSLRSITAKSLQQDLLIKIQAESGSKAILSKVEGSPVYGKFMELVKASIKGIPSRRTLKQMSMFNELALSLEVSELAHQTAKSLQGKLVGKPFAMAQKIENEHVKQIVMQEVMPKGTVNPASILLKGITKVTGKGRWATHSDLQEVASQLNVNLYVDGELNGARAPGFPIVTLNNLSNDHWTTTVEQLNPEPKGKKNKRDKDEENPRPKKRARHEKAESNEESEASIYHTTMSLEHGKKKGDKDELPRLKDKKDVARAEQVIECTVSAQVMTDKVDSYKQHIKALVYASLTKGLFAHVTNKIDVDSIDKAAAVHKKRTCEPDESFASRVQEAELRRVNL